MKLRDLKHLLARAAAALETPDDLTPEDETFLIEDLRTAEDEHDVDLDEPEILTHAQIARWVRLQHKRPGYEIERDPFSIGYWGRQLDWARPEEPGDELDGWLKADSELKAGCIEGNAPQTGPEPGPLYAPSAAQVTIREAAKHWQMLGYTTIKMPDGSRYDFRGTDTKSLEEHAKDHRGRIFREQRWLDAVMLFLDGETVSDPNAIR